MPLFEDAAFRALQSGLDAMWLKQQVASHNIANVETPDFKAKKVEFKRRQMGTVLCTRRLSVQITTRRPGRTGITYRWKKRNWTYGRRTPSIQR